MWSSGKRAFSLGSVLLLLIAIAHGMGTFSTPTSGTLPVRLMLKAMAAVTAAEGLGLHGSLYDVMADLSLFMSLACGLWGLQNLLLARVLEPGSAAFRILAWGGFLFSLASSALGGLFGIAPPLVTFGIAALCFLVAIKRVA